MSQKKSSGGSAPSSETMLCPVLVSLHIWRTNVMTKRRLVVLRFVLCFIIVDSQFLQILAASPNPFQSCSYSMSHFVRNGQRDAHHLHCASAVSHPFSYAPFPLHRTLHAPPSSSSIFTSLFLISQPAATSSEREKELKTYRSQNVLESLPSTSQKPSEFFTSLLGPGSSINWKYLYVLHSPTFSFHSQIRRFKHNRTPTAAPSVCTTFRSRRTKPCGRSPPGEKHTGSHRPHMFTYTQSYSIIACLLFVTHSFSTILKCRACNSPLKYTVVECAVCKLVHPQMLEEHNRPLCMMQRIDPYSHVPHHHTHTHAHTR